jgi:phosphinothricin acetyltransferase
MTEIITNAPTITADQVNIREAVLSDAPVLTDIYNYYIQTTTYSFRIDLTDVSLKEEQIKERQGTNPFLVATVNDKVIGYAYTSDAGSYEGYNPTKEISIYLDPHVKAHGIGGKLYHALEDEILANYPAIYKIISLVTGTNETSLKFHQKHGFTEYGRCKNMGYKFDQWLDVVYLEKNIRPIH